MALLLNDEELIERAEILREKGTNRSRFFRGQVDKYTWTDIGSSYLPSDILAAVLMAQLEEREVIQAKRKTLWDKYYLELECWSKQNGIKLPVVPSNCQQSFHMFYLLMPSLEIRSKFIAYLDKLSIGAVFHYIPLHTSPMGESLGGKVGQCPITEDISERLVRLPFFTSMTESQQEKVIQAVVNFSA
ncbi:MAG: DegT/DnrJ/EryC1/StrS family aminotransferase [Candidatus Obscuribacterales bacterium]|nr:DegT/DnrJ/EryC1/StrS family aminotransferase [Candidatus Obscuribacterales bacterium]